MTSRASRYRAMVLGVVSLGVTLFFLLWYRAGIWKAVTQGSRPGPLLRAEAYFTDMIQNRGRRAPLDPDLVFVGIDSSSTELGGASDEEIAASPALSLMKKEWPWDRSVHAMILDRLVEAGAKVVMFDFLFLKPGLGDAAFRDALDRHGDHAVLASNFDFDPANWDLRAAPTLPVESLIPRDGPPTARFGYVNYYVDPDGVVRRARLQLVSEAFGNEAFDAQSEVHDSLAAAALRQLGRADLIPGRAPVEFRYAGPAGTFHPRPVYELFVPSLWKANYGNGAFFKDKIVMLGPAGGFHHDAHRTPLDDAMPGPEIHLNVLNAVLQHEFLTETSPSVNSALIVLAGLGAWIIGVFIRQPAFRFIALVAVSAGALAALLILFNRTGVLTTTATPLLVFNFAGGLGLVYDFVLERMEKGRFRRTLERYVSKNVVKEILDNPQSYINTLGGMRRPIALLFTDLRGFTSMTEEADSVKFVAQLNEYFTEMVKPVFANDGTLDKFIGDAIMAVWGNVYNRGPGHDVRMAVKAALEMKEALARLNQKWQAQGMRSFAMGMGINYGDVLCGNIGSPEKMDMTAIGDAVNLASRIEGLTKQYQVDLLLGEEAAAQVRDIFHLQTVDLVQVKGKSRPVTVSTVLGWKSEPLPESQRIYVERYETGVVDYRQRRFEAAAAAFNECLQLQPNDFLAEMYRTRCAHLLSAKPDESWNGIFVMTEK